MSRSNTITKNWSKFLRFFLEEAAIILVYAVGYALTENHNLLGFLWMLCGCVALFLYFTIYNHNLFDLRAIVIASITGGVACCQLRLSDIQVVWHAQTWICHVVGLCAFCTGCDAVEFFSSEAAYKKKKRTCRSKLCRNIKFGFQPKKAYYATIFLAVMPIVLFCIQAKIKGFIPIFVQRYDAYVLFYTRLSIFINLVMFAAPLAFWCLKNMELNLGQRILMWAIVPLPTIIFQLMVQRGLFVWSLCILLIMVYSQSKRKFLGVFLVAVLMVFGILFSSLMRGIPADAMKENWQLNDSITIDQPQQTVTTPVVTQPAPTDPVVTQPAPTDPMVTQPTVPDQTENPKTGITINIPSFLYAPYYYVINGLENFNNMVVKLEQYSWGLRQIVPFTVILRFPQLKQIIAQLPNFSILPNSTRCLYYDIYHDFGMVGIVIEMLLLGALCMIVQMLARKKNDLFAYLEYGVLLAVMLTAFFAAWISEFGTWLFAGTAFLIFLYTYFSKAEKHERKDMDV